MSTPEWRVAHQLVWQADGRLLNDAPAPMGDRNPGPDGRFERGEMVSRRLSIRPTPWLPGRGPSVRYGPDATTCRSLTVPTAERWHRSARRAECQDMPVTRGRPRGGRGTVAQVALEVALEGRWGRPAGSPGRRAIGIVHESRTEAGGEGPVCRLTAISMLLALHQYRRLTRAPMPGPSAAPRSASVPRPVRLRRSGSCGSG